MKTEMILDRKGTCCAVVPVKPLLCFVYSVPMVAGKKVHGFMMGVGREAAVLLKTEKTIHFTVKNKTIGAWLPGLAQSFGHGDGSEGCTENSSRGVCALCLISIIWRLLWWAIDMIHCLLSRLHLRTQQEGGGEMLISLSEILAVSCSLAMSSQAFLFLTGRVILNKSQQWPAPYSFRVTSNFQN